MGVAALVCSGPAYADDNQVNRGPVPRWVVQSQPMPVPQDPTGAVFVRYQDTEVRLDAKGQAMYTGYRIKILQPAALQLGNLSLAWNPQSGAPIVHSIRIYRDGETIDVLQTAAFEILRREEQLEMASLNGMLTAVLKIPDLRVGDELEVATTVRFGDPTLGKATPGLLGLGAEPQPGRFRLSLAWEDDARPQIRMTPDLAAVIQQTPQGIVYQIDNPPSLYPPKDAPPRYHWQRMIEFSGFTEWSDIGRRFFPLFARAATLASDSPLKKEAARIAAANPLPLDRAAAALRLVQQNVRYIYVGLNGGNYIPATADQTWQRRYGDCKGKTALLLGLLHELDIPAQAVLVNNSGGDDGLDARLPSPLLFDHVLVRAQIDGKAYWLDGTMPPVASPSPTPVLPYEWVLPLAEKEQTIERLAWKPAPEPGVIALFDIDARAGFAKPAHITSTTITRGVEGLTQDAQLATLSHDQLVNAFRQNAIGQTWQAIDDVQWHYDQKARASILTISGTGMLDWTDDGNGAKSMSLPGGGFNPPERKARSAEQDQHAPYYNKPEFDCRVTTVRPPSATNLVQWSDNTSFNTRIFGKNYYREFDIRDGAIRMVRGFRVEQREVDAASAQRDNARVAGFDNSMAWANYNPAGKRAPEPFARKIPATYDIDWVADSSACLADGTPR